MSLCCAGEEGPAGSGLHGALFRTWHPPAASPSREEIAVGTTLSFTEGHYFHTNACVGLEKVSFARFILPVTQIYQDLCEQPNALLSLFRLCGFWASSLTALAGLKSVYNPGTGRFVTALCCLFKACAEKSNRPWLLLRKICSISWGLSGGICVCPVE